MPRTPGLTKETIKRVDALVGTLLCALLTLHRAVLDRVRRSPEPPVRRILFLKLIEQGATVLAAPAIERAVARVGRENVYFCVFKENRPILDLLGLVPPENVLEVRHGSFVQFCADVLRALGRVRRDGVDTVIDMEFLARAPAILAYLTGARRRVGLHRFTAEGPYRGDLMTHRVAYSPYLHTSVAYDLLVRALDEDPTDLPLVKAPVGPPPARPRFWPTSEEVARVRGVLAEVGAPDGATLVLLNPNTGDLLPIRKWPTERFVELGQRLLAAYPDVTLVVTGAPSERAGAEDVARRIGGERVVCVAGKTTMRELVVLYSLGAVLVTNDSGPGHFSSLTDIHNVVIFGPETPQLFGPLGDNARVLWAGLACSPCVNPYNHRFSPCSTNRCMAAVTTDQVYEVVAGCLGERAAARTA